MLKEERPERGERKENSSRASTTEVNRLFLRHNTQTRGGVLLRFRFVCLYFCFFVLSPRSFRRLLQPRIKAAYTEKVFRNGGKPALGGSPKSRRGEMGADRRRVCGVGERHGEKNGKNKRKKTKTRMRYVTNAAADGEDGERLGRENAMSRLITLIGNLGAADFQGFVFFSGGRCQNHGASQKGLRQPENK